MKLRAMLAALTMVLSISPLQASAEPTAKDLIEADANDDDLTIVRNLVFQTYYDAFMWASIFVEVNSDGQSGIYCPPRNIVMQTEQVKSIFIEFIKNHPDQSEQAAGIVMLMALRDAFPCD